jgi:hypothetical protein
LKLRLKIALAGSALAVAFLAMGPLQHFGIIGETALGTASKQLIKAGLGYSVKEAHACIPGTRFGNNGFGNGGFDGVPGNSGFNPAPNAAQKLADEVR